MTKPSTRAQWAKRICAASRKTITAMIETGRLLIAAKKQLDHGQFIAMVRNDLPFRERMAQRFMAIAHNPTLSNASCVTLLPPHVATLTALAKLPPAELAAKVEAGEITPTTRVKVKIKKRTQVIRSVAYVTDPRDSWTPDPPDPGMPRALDDLENAIAAVVRAALKATPSDWRRVNAAIEALTELRDDNERREDRGERHIRKDLN